jgi:hypothetical protein
MSSNNASNSFSAPIQVAAKKVNSRGKRAGRRGRDSTTAEIQRVARDRQHAWLESSQPNRTYQLTRELDGLYNEHREEQAGTLVDPYYGKTSQAGRS